MTKNFTVTHQNGTSTIENVGYVVTENGDLLFSVTGQNIFAGFAAGTWFTFAEVKDAEPLANWERELLWSKNPGDVLTPTDLEAMPHGHWIKDKDGDTWLKADDGRFNVRGDEDAYPLVPRFVHDDYGPITYLAPPLPEVGTEVTEAEFLALPEGTEATFKDYSAIYRREGSGAVKVKYATQGVRPDNLWNENDFKGDLTSTDIIVLTKVVGY